MFKVGNSINVVLKLILLSFPILIILGPFALNCFSIIFSFYAVINYKSLNELKFFNKKILIIFLSFIILIFPFESVEFENAFLKYLSFFRFVLMLFGLIIFFEKGNKNNVQFFKIHKVYLVILIVITIDILVEHFSGSNLLGYSTLYKGRIASFTNDELIIGYIFCFLVLFTLTFIYKKTNLLIFFITLFVFLNISMLIGEKSNFIKLFFLIIMFTFAHFFYLHKFKIKKLLIVVPIIFVFLISFFQLTKNTIQAQKFYSEFENLVVFENNKVSLKIEEEFLNTKHYPHYFAAYKIFLNYPVFGIGINNFYLESNKELYKLKPNCGDNIGCTHSGKFQVSSTHPHQLYLEIISEVGLTGLIYFIFIFFYPIYISVRSFIKSKEIHLVSHLLLHIYFIFPFLPSGSFFGTNYGIPFWFNLSILLYLSNKNLKFNKY